MPPAARCPARPPKRSGTRCATPPAALDRPELRARREGPARLHRGAVAGGRYARQHPSERRPAERLRRVRRDAGVHGRDILASSPSAGLHEHRRAAAAARRPSTSAPSPKAVAGVAPRADPALPSHKQAPALGPRAAQHRPDSLFVNVGERTNVTGSKAFARLILDGRYERCARRGAPAGGQRRAGHRREHGRGDARLGRRWTTFLNLIAAEPDISRVPVMLDSSKWSVIEAGLKCLQGKGIVNSISMKEGEAEFLRQARLVRRYGAAAVVMAFDEQGQADTLARRVEICTRAYHLLTKEVGFPPEDIIFDPNIFAIATGIDEHDNYGIDFIEATRRIRAFAAARARERRRLERLVLVPRQRSGARGDPHGLPVPRGAGRHDHGHRQRRAARRLRRSRSRRSARARRGRPLQPPPDATERCFFRRALQGRGRRSSSRISPGATPPSPSASSTRW
jgi:hypothetical protein